MPYGNFYYGKTGFFYKKSGATGARYNPSLAAICNQPQDVNNRYVPGAGVGASSTAQRRAKLIHSYNSHAPQKDGQGPQRLGVFAQGGSNAYALNWGLYNYDNQVRSSSTTIISNSAVLSSVQAASSTPSAPFITLDSQDISSFVISFPLVSGATSYKYFLDGVESNSSTSSSPITISSLSVGINYSVYIVAINSAGSSSPSNTINVTLINIFGPATFP
jgi:hypothetical protein